MLPAITELNAALEPFHCVLQPVQTLHDPLNRSMARPAAGWLDKQWWPLLGITGITVASMGVWWRRKASQVRSIDNAEGEA